MKNVLAVVALLLALVGGESLAFGQAAGASIFANTGCVVQKSGAAIIVDETGNQIFELRGMDLRKVIGSHVQILGTIDTTARPAAGASQVVKVSKAVVTKKGGCASVASKVGATTTAAGLAAGAAGAGAGAAAGGAAAGAGAAAAGAAAAGAASAGISTCALTLFVGCWIRDGVVGVVHLLHDDEPKADKPAKPQPGPTREALLKAANQQLKTVKPVKSRFTQQDIYRMAYTNGPYGEDIMIRLNSALTPYSLIVGKGNLFWVLMTQSRVEAVEVGPGMKSLVASGAIVTSSAPWSGSVLVFKYQDPKAGSIEIPLVRLDTADILIEVPQPAAQEPPIKAIPAVK
jgi:hypothetical protein